MSILDITKRNISRRSFLKGASFGVGIPVLGGVLAACARTPPAAATQNMQDMTPAAQSQPAAMTADEMDAIIERYGEVQGRFEELGGYALEARAREVLDGLSFSQEMMDGDVGKLSGGWKMRVA